MIFRDCRGSLLLCGLFCDCGRTVNKIFADEICDVRTQEATEQLLFGIFYDIGFFDCVLTCEERTKG